MRELPLRGNASSSDADTQRLAEGELYAQINTYEEKIKI
jgi:hypothetical protein